MPGLSRRLNVSTAALAVALALVSAGSAAAQGAVVTGRVVGATGEQIEGAQVYIQEVGAQSISNDAGTYNLVIPSERVRGQSVTLRVRRIGYTPDEREITLTPGSQTVDFTLQRDINRLSEIVVTGVTAGTERTRVPFSVATVNVADTPVPATNPLSQLQGKVAGVNIVSGNGRPGTSPSIILRGPASINATGRGQDPLYIVDGVIISGPLPDINALDIETVEVVKGAAASSLYGARAGNGVVQITTKSGRAQAEGVRFTFRSEYGISDIERDFGLARNTALLTDATGTMFCQSVTGEQTCSRAFDYRLESARINNNPELFALSPAGFPVDPGASTTQWALRSLFQATPWPGPTYNAVEQVVDPQPFTMNNLDMMGRIGPTNVFASVSMTEQGGAIRFLDGYTRTSARLNVDQSVGDKWNISLRSYFAQSEEDGAVQDNSSGGGTGSAFFRLTRVPAIVNLMARDTLGRLYIRPNLQSSGAQNENPLYNLSALDRADERTRFIGGATISYAPLDWLDLEGNLSYDGSRIQFSEFRDKDWRATTSQFLAGQRSYLFKGNNSYDSYNGSLNATLSHVLMDGDLNTRTSFRYLFERQDLGQRTGFGQDLAVQGVPTLGNTTSGRVITSIDQSIRQVGIFGGVNLEYLERYIVDALVRRDGSSLFGENERWATFGRASLAWRLSQEPWWFAPQLNEFKLRASYGTAGGRPSFAAQYETFVVTTGGVVQTAQFGNQNLKPEEVAEIEVGADVEVLNRYGLTVNYAQSESRGQILPVPVASATGFTSQWQNAGTLQSKTWELSLNVPIIERPDMSWSTRFIWDRNRTVITELGVPPFNFGTSLQATETMFRAAEGERFGTIYGRVFLTDCAQLPTEFQGQCGASGAFQRNDDGYLVWVGEGNDWREGVTKNLWSATLPSADAPWGTGLFWGMPIMLRDETGSGQVVPIGNALPDFRFAISQNFNWRRLTVYGLLDASIGQEVWNQGKHWAHLDFLSADIDQGGKSIENAKPIGYYWRGGPPDHPAGLGGFYNALAPNSHFVEDASFMKLREATISYRIGSIGGMGDWDVSVVGRNLLTFTDYTGFDPEVGVPSGDTFSTQLFPVNGQAGSGALNAVDAFTFPNLRSFTFGVSTRF